MPCNLIRPRGWQPVPAGGSLPRPAWERLASLLTAALLWLALVLAPSEGAAAVEDPGLSLVVVVDTSGSMAADLAGNSPRRNPAEFEPPTRIDYLVGALQAYADQLAEIARHTRVRLRLISFNSGIRTNQEFDLSTPGQAERLQRAIDALRKEPGPRADTHLWEALRVALREAETYVQEDPDVTVDLYVLTDGVQDNQSADRERDISFGKVLGESPHLAGDGLYGSLVLLGRAGGGFTQSAVQALREEAAGRFDVELSEDFTPILPPIIATPARIGAGETAMIVDRAPGSFQRYQWEINGERQAGEQRTLDYRFPSDGRYEIKVTALDAKGRRARARKVITIHGAEVSAVPRVTIDGKALNEAGVVTVGQTLSLAHDSSGPVERVVWALNGRRIEADSLSEQLTRPGRYEISLTVESRPDATGATRSDTSPALRFEVLPPRLEARPLITVEGRALAEVESLHPGDVVLLSSANTANASGFLWEINGERLRGQSVNWRIPAAGEYEIVHRVVGAAPGDGASPPEHAAAPIRLLVTAPVLTAVAEVLRGGRPVEQLERLFVGDTLQLVSRSTGPVHRALWTVNEASLEGDLVTYEILAPGELRIQLTVEGGSPEQRASSGITRVTARQPPPVWVLWAGGFIALLAALGACHLFLGNHLRGYSLVAQRADRGETLGRVSLRAKSRYWSRLTKEGRVTAADLGLDHETVWPAAAAFKIGRNPVSRGAPQLTFPFEQTAPESAGLEQAEVENAHCYDLLDRAHGERYRLAFEYNRRPSDDLIYLALSLLLIASAWLYLWVKVYPALLGD